jgi:pyridoxine 5-phosphate synthase
MGIPPRSRGSQVRRIVKNKAGATVFEWIGFSCPRIEAVSAMLNLLVNVDHVGTLRNARKATVPDPVHAAGRCEHAGADGIVFHLREDRRHVTERDVHLFRETVQGKLDFELSTDEDIVSICCDVAPDLATLVPERREEVTTEGGLDVDANRERLNTVIARLFDAGVEQVSLFVDPVPEQIEAAAETDANCVELHTGDFADAPTDAAQQAEAERLARGAETAHEAGLRVHAGHGLNYRNVPLFRKTVPHVAEISIGFAIVARAVLVGLDQAVRDMRATVKGY